jgi:hypothetical protein
MNANSFTNSPLGCVGKCNFCSKQNLQDLRVGILWYEDVWANVSKAPHILNLGSQWWWMIDKLHASPLFIREECRYSLDLRLVGTQSGLPWHRSKMRGRATNRMLVVQPFVLSFLPWKLNNVRSWTWFVPSQFTLVTSTSALVAGLLLVWVGWPQ